MAQPAQHAQKMPLYEKMEKAAFAQKEFGLLHGMYALIQTPILVHPQIAVVLPETFHPFRLEYFSAYPARQIQLLMHTINVSALVGNILFLIEKEPQFAITKFLITNTPTLLQKTGGLIKQKNIKTSVSPLSFFVAK